VIKKFAATGEIDLANTVNRSSKDSTSHKISVRHSSQVGVLSHVMGVLAEHNLLVLEMENIVFAQREACVANICISGDWTDAEKICEKIKAHQHVIDVKF